MTKDEICTCGHAGRDHSERICLVAACDCRKAVRAAEQPEKPVERPVAAMII